METPPAEELLKKIRELEESQAQVLHQEKMAAFGLLAAGIAHEVGNPLTSISAVVQLLDRRDHDEYTREKLTLVNGQLARIQTTLRELVTFSRPASDERGRVSVREVVDEALGIAKYYKGGKNRTILADVPSHLPYGQPQGDLRSDELSALAPIRMLRKPTPSWRFGGARGSHWRLIAHLALNHAEVEVGAAVEQLLVDLRAADDEELAL